MALAWRLGSNDANGTAAVNRYSDPLSPLPEDPTAYHPAFDRSAAAPGAGPWDLGPPDGQIFLSELMAMIVQYGHNCAN